MKQFLFFLLSFSTIFTLSSQTDPLAEILKIHPDYFAEILKNQDQHNTQIIYTQINRDADNIPSFQTYTHGFNEEEYFYPASTVKMPTAFLALEKLNQLGLNKSLEMQTRIGHAPQSEVKSDSSAENFRASVEHYIKKIFVASDNDAYNRLYEFLGQGYLNSQLKNKGLDHSRIIHRLSVGGFDLEGNRWTNPIQFYDKEQLVYQQGEIYSRYNWDFKLKNEIRGLAHLGTADTIVPAPFNFKAKNYTSLMDLHDALKAILFPEVTPIHQQFHLTTEDYKFLYEWMSKLPRESNAPKYDEPDNYVKFYFGTDTSAVMPDHIRIFNKVGWAYGYLTDVSYIIDTKNKVEFLIAANIHVNANQTYNDGVYEYEAIGLPFFAHLGKTIYEYELQRPRKYRPNLSKFVQKHIN